MEELKTTPQDWFNHVAQGLTSNALIQYVIKPDGKIDYQLLLKSVLLSFKAETVLGCIFVEKDPAPVWRSVSDEEKYNNACCLVNTQNMEEEINAVLGMEINASVQLPVKVFLIDDKESNVVVIKISHSVCDGAGSKYYLDLLTGIYAQLEENNSFIPKKNIMARDTKYFYKASGVDDIESYFNPQKAELISSWGFPANKKIHTSRKFYCRLLRYRKNEYRKIRQYAKDQGVTINTFLVTVYFYALIETFKITENRKEIQFMVDLRKYLPDEITQTICNLSAILNVELHAKTEDFTERIKHVNESLQNVLASDAVVHGTIAGDLAEGSGYNILKDFFKTDWRNIEKTGNCTPMISNLGLFASENIKFGKTEIEDLYFVSPAFYAPAFMLGISTYDGVLTICASYYNPGINHKDIDCLLKKIDCEVKAVIS